MAGNSRADDEARTRDLNLGKVALYQLSYVRLRRRRTRRCEGNHSRSGYPHKLEAHRARRTPRSHCEDELISGSCALG